MKGRRGPEMTANDESPGRLKPKRSTRYFLAATVVLVIAASLVGIADNPPGIVLLYGAGLTGVLAIAHRWRSPDKFGYLLAAAIVGFFVMAIAHNFAEVGAEQVTHLPVLAFLLTAVSVIGFLAAVIVCPAAGVVGLVGWVATLGRKDQQSA